MMSEILNARRYIGLLIHQHCYEPIIFYFILLHNNSVRVYKPNLLQNSSSNSWSRNTSRKL